MVVAWGSAVAVRQTWEENREPHVETRQGWQYQYRTKDAPQKRDFGLVDEVW